MTPTIGRTKNWDSLGLYNFLYDKLPEYRTANGALDVRTLGRDIDASHECVYKWLRADRLPVRRVNSLIGISEGKITKDDLKKFVMNI